MSLSNSAIDPDELALIRAELQEAKEICARVDEICAEVDETCARVDVSVRATEAGLQTFRAEIQEATARVQEVEVGTARVMQKSAMATRQFTSLYLPGTMFRLLAHFGAFIVGGKQPHESANQARERAADAALRLAQTLEMHPNAPSARALPRHLHPALKLAAALYVGHRRQMRYRQRSHAGSGVLLPEMLCLVFDDRQVDEVAGVAVTDRAAVAVLVREWGWVYRGGMWS